MSTTQLTNQSPFCTSRRSRLLSTCCLIISTLTPLPSHAAEFDPCSLLSLDQVKNVLPNASSASVDHAGASLLAGINAYQCNYLNTQMEMVSLILNVAKDAKLFQEIKPSSAVRENRQPVNIGDEAWIVSTAGEVRLKIAIGNSVIDLDAMIIGVETKTAQMIELGKLVAAKVK